MNCDVLVMLFRIWDPEKGVKGTQSQIYIPALKEKIL
jgi:hypothetical protein